MMIWNYINEKIFLWFKSNVICRSNIIFCLPDELTNSVLIQYICILEYINQSLRFKLYHIKDGNNLCSFILPSEYHNDFWTYHFHIDEICAMNANFDKNQC